MWKRLNSNQMCEQFSYKEVSYREVLLYIFCYINDTLAGQWNSIYIYNSNFHITMIIFLRSYILII